MNAPFVGLAVRRKGWPFTVRSTVSLGLLSAFSALHTVAVPEITVDPVLAVLTLTLMAAAATAAIITHRNRRFRTWTGYRY